MRRHPLPPPENEWQSAPPSLRDLRLFGASHRALLAWATAVAAVGVVAGAPALAQVVISTPQSTAQNLDVLPNPGNLNTADVAANVNTGVNIAIVGTARPWVVTIEPGISLTGTGGVRLLNAGGGSVTIGANAVITAPGGNGISIEQGVGTVVNAGSIQARGGVQLTFGGSFTNQAGAVVSGQVGGVAAGAPATIVNAGTITAFDATMITQQAINMDSGTITNLPGAMISSNGFFAITATLATLTNAGTITATGANGGAAVGMGGNGTYTNSGTISGTAGAAMSLFGTNFTLINSGTISGINAPALRLGVDVLGTTTLINTGTITATGGVAVQFGNGINTVMLQPGSTIVGQLMGGAGSNTALVQGATVSGATGFVNFNVVNSIGTMAPGTSGNPGVLPIAGGNYTQLSGGTLSIVVTPNAASKLTVTGSAALGGTLALQVVPSFAYTIGTRYPILTAGGGVTGAFSQTTGAAISPILSLGSTYLSNEVDLTVQLTGLGGAPATFAGFGVTGNQRSVGAALDVVTQTAPSAFTPLLGALTALPNTAQIQSALDQVGGSAQGYAGLASSAIGGSLAISGALGQQVFATHGATSGAAALAQGPSAQRVQLASLDPVAALAQGPAPAPFTMASPWSAWLTGFGTFGGVGGNGNAAGLRYSTGGTVFGADYRLDPSLLVGAFASYAGTGTSVSGLSADGSISSYTAGGYASWTVDRLYVDSMLGYSYDDDQLTRTIAFPGFSAVNARASTRGNQFLSSVETGRSYDLPDTFIATPFVGLQGTTLSQASFTESGAGALNLAVGGQSTSSVRSQLGTRLSRDLDLADLGVGIPAGTLVNASLKLGWAHEFSDTGSSTTASFVGAPGASFSVQGAQRGRDSALVGIGIATKLDPQSSVYLRYDGDLDGPDNAHAVIGGIRLTW